MRKGEKKSNEKWAKSNIKYIIIIILLVFVLRSHDVYEEKKWRFVWNRYRKWANINSLVEESNQTEIQTKNVIICNMYTNKNQANLVEIALGVAYAYICMHVNASDFASEPFRNTQINS